MIEEGDAVSRVHYTKWVWWEPRLQVYCMNLCAEGCNLLDMGNIGVEWRP